jgi:hypothetical protein
MPLNIQNTEGPKNPPPGRPAGSPPPPDDGSRGGITRLLLWIFAVVVIASVFFLLIQFGIIPGGTRKSSGTGPAETPVVDTARPRAVAADSAAGGNLPGGRKGDTERAAELRHRLADTSGGLTIFISAFNSASDAQELASRWERAGYPSWVQHSGGWYRVALGRYASVAAAREDAEKLRQALEEGYWIGSVGTE